MTNAGTKLYTYSREEFDAAKTNEDKEKLKNAAHTQALVVNARVDRILSLGSKRNIAYITDEEIDEFSALRTAGPKFQRKIDFIADEVLVESETPRTEGRQFLGIQGEKLAMGYPIKVNPILIIVNGKEYEFSIETNIDGKNYSAVIPAEKLGKWNDEYHLHPNIEFLESIKNTDGTETYVPILDGELQEKIRADIQFMLDMANPN